MVGGNSGAGGGLGRRKEKMLQGLMCGGKTRRGKRSTDALPFTLGEGLEGESRNIHRKRRLSPSTQRGERSRNSIERRGEGSHAAQWGLEQKEGGGQIKRKRQEKKGQGEKVYTPWWRHKRRTLEGKRGPAEKGRKGGLYGKKRFGERKEKTHLEHVKEVLPGS